MEIECYDTTYCPGNCDDCDFLEKLQYEDSANQIKIVCSGCGIIVGNEDQCPNCGKILDG